MPWIMSGAPPQRPHRRRVLLSDGDAVRRSEFERVFRDCGWEVVGADTAVSHGPQTLAEAALLEKPGEERSAADMPDACVLAVDGRCEDVFPLLDRLVDEQRIAVIAVSDRCSVEQRIELLRRGVLDVLHHPWPIMEAVARIEAWMRAVNPGWTRHGQSDDGMRMEQEALHPPVPEFDRCIEGLLDSGGLSEDALAGALGMPLPTVRDLVRLRTGVPLRRFLLFRRLERARDLLGRTRRTVADIGRSCGFTHPTYFIRTFRREFGIQPKQYQLRAHAEAFDRALLAGTSVRVPRSFTSPDPSASRD